MDIVLFVSGHLSLLNLSDSSTGENHHYVHCSKITHTADGRASGVPRCTCIEKEEFSLIHNVLTYLTCMFLLTHEDDGTSVILAQEVLQEACGAGHRQIFKSQRLSMEQFHDGQRALQSHHLYYIWHGERGQSTRHEVWNKTKKRQAFEMHLGRASVGASELPSKSSFGMSCSGMKSEHTSHTSCW